jgi:hypothetical protein
MIALALTARDASASVGASTWADVAKIENVTAAMTVTTIVLGLVESLWGGRGFARHRWLLMKWLLALSRFKPWRGRSSRAS